MKRLEADSFNSFSGVSPPTKVCNSCKQENPVESFYYNRTLNYHESTCKECKKRERRERHKNKKPASDVQKNLSKSYQEKDTPRACISDHPDEGAKNTSDPTISYTYWEKKYGRTLSEVERLEIYTNLTSFFKTLIEEEAKHEQQT